MRAVPEAAETGIAHELRFSPVLAAHRVSGVLLVGEKDAMGLAQVLDTAAAQGGVARVMRGLRTPVITSSQARKTPTRPPQTASEHLPQLRLGPSVMAFRLQVLTPGS